MAALTAAPPAYSARRHGPLNRTPGPGRGGAPGGMARRHPSCPRLGGARRGWPARRPSASSPSNRSIAVACGSCRRGGGRSRRLPRHRPTAPRPWQPALSGNGFTAMFHGASMQRARGRWRALGLASGVMTRHHKLGALPAISSGNIVVPFAKGDDAATAKRAFSVKRMCQAIDAQF